MYAAAVAAAAVATLVTSAPARASETDSRIESTLKASYVYLKDDSVKADAKNGVVT
jgi:hypothetical protein